MEPDRSRLEEGADTDYAELEGEGDGVPTTQGQLIELNI